jgi:hypothetical protein
VLSPGRNLWRERVPFGTVPPARQQVDGNVAAFDAIDLGAVYVLGSTGDAALWQEFAPFGTVPPARLLVDRLVIQAYRFSLDSFQILNTRSGNIFSTSKDTDYVSFALTVNNGRPQVITQSMGDLSNGTYSTNLTFDKVNIADSDNVVLTYHIINSSVGEANATTYLQKSAFTLSNAAVQALATSTAALLGTAIGAAIGTEIPVPLIGSALGALAGWLLGSAWGIAFPDCDGPVAAGVHVFSGASLRAMTTGQTFTSTENNPGVNSPAGCGSNSSYNVTWSVSVG